MVFQVKMLVDNEKGIISVFPNPQAVNFTLTGRVYGGVGRERAGESVFVVHAK